MSGGQGKERRPRAELVAEILRLKAQGLNNREVALAMGKAPNTVRALLDDPDGSKLEARRQRYKGVCVDCGHPTSTGKDGKPPAPRCHYCMYGKERPRAKFERLRVPIRLSEIPEDVRLHAVGEASRIYRDPAERLELLLVAIAPSDEIYWVAESALPLIQQWEGWVMAA